MNKEALMITRNAVAASHTYDQQIYTHAAESNNPHTTCHTPACVAAHVVAAHGYTFIMDHSCRSDKRPKSVFIKDAAKEILGLTLREESSMFDGQPFGQQPATKEEALRMIDYAIATNTVDWASTTRDGFKEDRG